MTSNLRQWNLILLILPLLIHCNNAANSIATTSLDSSATDTDGDGVPDIYASVQFTLNATLTVTLDVGVQKVEVILTRPGQARSSTQGCISLVDNSLVSGSCSSVPYTESDISWNFSNAIVTTSNGYQASIHKAYVAGSSDLKIIASLYYSNVGSQVSETITVQQPVTVKRIWSNLTQEFMIDANILNATNDVIASTSQKNYIVEVIGPFLEGSASRSNSAVTGSPITANITIQHSSIPSSTEDAYNLRVSFVFTQSGALESPITDVTININNTGAVTLSNYQNVLLSTHTGSSLFNIGSTVVFDFTRSVGDEILVGQAISIVYTATWENSNGNTYSFRNGVYTATPDLTFTDSTDIDIPSTLFPGETFTFRRTFTMPTGKLASGTSVRIVATSSDMTDMPVSTTSAVLTYNTITYSSHVTTDATYTNQISGTASKQWSVSNTGSSGRKKRAIDLILRRSKRSTSWSLSVPLGAIVNKLSGGSSVSVPFTITLSFLVTSAASGGSATAVSSMIYNGNTAYFNSSTTAFFVPLLQISKAVGVVDTSAYPHKVRFNVTVEHTTTSNSPAYSVSLKDSNTDFKVFFYDNFLPGFPQNEISVANEAEITYSQPQLNASESMFLSYKAEPVNSGKSFPKGNTTYTAVVTWYAKSSPDTGMAQNNASVCLSRNDIVKESLFYQHGFTVLGLICGIIAGALLGVLIVLILWLCRNKMPCVGGVGPSYRSVGNSGKGLVTSASAAMKKGYVTIKDLSTVAINDSIVLILALKDKFKQNRQLDNLDIVQTIHVDEDIEKERNDAMIKSTKLLIASMRLHGDITKGAEEKCNSKFAKNLANAERNLENDYKKEMQDIFKRLSLKNKNKLEEQNLRQRMERQELEEKLRNSGMTNEEKDELRKLQKEEQELEDEDLNYRLKLEQDEEAEKLRKEYSIRKRMAFKTIQQEYIDDVVKEGKIPTQEQIDWLMKEHFKNQSAIETMYDDEISRQRMVLEEKLARRKALAQKTELQEEAHSDILNTIASQHMDSIKKAKKGGVLSPAEAKQMVADAQKEMIATKEKLDAERERQEKVLHEKMSQRKKEKMSELGKRQKQELDDLDKKINASMQTDGIDPLAAIQSRKQLVSGQRTETAELENEIDREHAKELEELRNQVSDKSKTELQEHKEKTLGELGENGLSDRDIQKMLQKHDKDLEVLEEQLALDKAAQDAKFKKKLAAQRKEWARRKEQEKEEQVNLREYEENVARKLMDNQVAMSEEERNKILQEHEKQMVKLENSLTLNKISQKRMLEEKLAKKRAQQLEKLERKQATEVKKAKKEVDSEDDDNVELDLMKKHAEQRMSVMQGEKLSMEDEMGEIREAMNKERAGALKEQEVKLAAMLADLQMAKAKEMAKIEEQQKAIHNLTANLMDDLNEKGVLSDPECQKVIKIHQEEQEKLSKKLDSQREKQEKEFQRRLYEKMKSREASMVKIHQEEMKETEQADEKLLRQKLNERLKAKEDQMSRMQQNELNDTIKGLGNTPAAKIRRAALLTKHMVEVEKFRNRMEKEINQTLEELRRQNDMRRMNMIQEQDLQFINGLVRLGKFNKQELENVVAMLFPTKTNEENKVILEKLMEGYKEEAAPKGKKGKEKNESPKRGLTRHTSTLEQRIKTASIAKVETASLQGSFRGRKYRILSASHSPGVNEMLRNEVQSTNDDPGTTKRLTSLDKDQSEDNLKKKGRKGRQVAPGYDEDFDESNLNSYPHHRPDPIGRSYTPDHYGDPQYRDPQYDQDFDMGVSSRGMYAHAPPATRLPPLENIGKKKKKKKQILDEDF